MIASIKNYTKINMKIRNKSVTDSKPQVYSCSQSPPPQFRVDSLSTQVFHRSRIHHVDCGDLMCCSSGCTEKFPFSSLFAQLLGFSFGLGSTSACRLPSGIYSHPDRMGLKQRLISWLWLTQARGREKYSSYNWNVGQACSGRGQHDIATA